MPGAAGETRRGEFVKLMIVAAITAALAAPSMALGEDPTYDENQNWLAAWGQTQKDFTDPGETAIRPSRSAGGTR